MSSSSTMMSRFKLSYRRLKESLPPHIAVELPSEIMAFSILKSTFVTNPDFAMKCLNRTIEPTDILTLTNAPAMLADVLKTATPSDYELLVENLAQLSNDFKSTWAQK